jgi:hypothetical protein
MDLNIKGVEPELAKKAKQAALDRDMTLKAWVIRVLEEATNGKQGSGMVEGNVRADVRDRAILAPKGRERGIGEIPPDEASEVPEAKGPTCPQCDGPLELNKGKWGCRECDKVWDKMPRQKR